MSGCAIQIVMGPAGAGKSTYCSVIQEHCATLGGSRKRTVHVGNLDPAAEDFRYNVTFDIRTELISVEEVMEELGLGPNGALVYCMEYLLQNLDWLQNHLETFVEDDYLILDCPGQIELYTHVPIMKTIIDKLQSWGYSNKMVSVFCIDASFCCDMSKFISGSLLALSSMIAMELPHINILTKCDLMPEEDVESILSNASAKQLWDTDQHYKQQQDYLLLKAATATPIVIDGENENEEEKINKEREIRERKEKLMLLQRRRKREKLTESICSVLDDYTMVSYVPLNIKEEESVDHVLNIVDHAIQYGEDLEVQCVENDDEQNEDDYVG